MRKKSGEKFRTSEILRGLTHDNIKEENSSSSKRRKSSRSFVKTHIDKGKKAQNPPRKIKSILKNSRRNIPKGREDSQSPSSKFRSNSPDAKDIERSLSPSNKSVRFHRVKKIYYIKKKKNGIRFG